MVALLIGCVMISFSAMPCFASQFVDEIEAVETDAKESQSLPGKVIPLKTDSRFLPVPIPISNPTVGTGLAVAGIYLHPKREGGTTGINHDHWSRRRRVNLGIWHFIAQTLT